MQEMTNIKEKRIKKRIKHIENNIFDEVTVQCLLKSEEDIKNGRTRPATEVIKELKEKYGF